MNDERAPVIEGQFVVKGEIPAPEPDHLSAHFAKLPWWAKAIVIAAPALLALQADLAAPPR